MKSINRFFTLVLCTLSVCVLLSTSAFAQPGHLVPVGGGALDNAFMLKFLSLSKVREPRVLIILYAAKDINTYLKKTQDSFQKAGVKDIRVLDLSDSQQAAKVIEESDIIWMSGGGQVRLRKALEKAGVADVIRKKHAEGTLIGGTSAGASVQTDVMMASSKRDPETKVLIPTLSYGLKLWPEVIIDQHFSERKRLERLETAVKRHPNLVGIGIDESTGVLYGGDHKFTVIGKGTVTVLRATNPQADKDNVELKKIILKAGDAYDLKGE